MSAASRADRIAIVGGGPVGLTAAYLLAAAPNPSIGNGSRIGHDEKKES